MGEPKLNEKGKGFYYRMVENFQRLLHFNYLVWRIDCILATPTTADFTIDDKKKLVKDILKELSKKEEK